MNINIPNNTVHDSSNLETTQMSISSGMSKYTMEYSYYRTPHNNENEQLQLHKAA